MHCDELLGSTKLSAIAEDENKDGVAGTAKAVRKSTVTVKRKKPAPKKAGRKAIGIKS